MKRDCYFIDPVAKPRMTQRDKWKKRPATIRYWAFKDDVKKAGVFIPESGAHITFHMPIPKGKKPEYKERIGKPHQIKPDKDNLEKALLDAIFDEDCRIWDSRVTKVWSDVGMIEITYKE